MTTNRTAFRNGRGFSLVELLVVVGIIALLIGILIPVVSRSRRAAMRTQCLSNLRQVTMAWVAYADAHNGNFVYADTGSGGWVNGGNLKSDIEQCQLYRYCTNATIFHCPADGSDHYRSYSINDFFNGEREKNSNERVNEKIDSYRRSNRQHHDRTLL